MPASSTSSSASSVRARPGEGTCRTVYTAHSAHSRAVSATSGQLIPSTPRWKRRPSDGTQA